MRPANISRVANIEDLRRVARRRVPKIFVDYVDGGSYSEATMRANVDDFDKWGMAPRFLVDVSKRTLDTTILGKPSALPIMIAPNGLTGMLWPKGEAEAAKAAHKAGIPLTLSTVSICTMEEVAAEAKSGFHFQLYLPKDKGLAKSFLDRAKACGAGAIHFTVDANLPALREKDLYNGLRFAGTPALRTMLDILAHPQWALAHVPTGRMPRFGNLPPETGRDLLEQTANMGNINELVITWEHLRWIRQNWDGKLVFKGAMTAEDARQAVDEGCDAVVVTNHGGRQMDGILSSVAVLPRIVAAVGHRTEIILDSGIRRGTQIAKALALGADSVMIGRAYLYGLAAAGEAGVALAIRLLADELSITLGSLGLNSIAELRAKGPGIIERI